MKKLAKMMAAAGMAVVAAGCASSSRMARLSGGDDYYRPPEEQYISSSRMRVEAAKDRALVDTVRETRAEEAAPADTAAAAVPAAERGPAVRVDFDDAGVNFWPFFYNDWAYTSVLWPFIDADKYGFAVRPFFNNEGDDYSVLFPLSSWNPAAGAGWATLVWWNPRWLYLFPTNWNYDGNGKLIAGGVPPLAWFKPGDYSFVFPLYYLDRSKWFSLLGGGSYGEDGAGFYMAGPGLHWRRWGNNNGRDFDYSSYLLLGYNDYEEKTVPSSLSFHSRWQNMEWVAGGYADDNPWNSVKIAAELLRQLPAEAGRTREEQSRWLKEFLSEGYAEEHTFGFFPLFMVKSFPSESRVNILLLLANWSERRNANRGWPAGVEGHAGVAVSRRFGSILWFDTSKKVYVWKDGESEVDRQMATALFRIAAEYERELDSLDWEEDMSRVADSPFVKFQMPDFAPFKERIDAAVAGNARVPHAPENYVELLLLLETLNREMVTTGDGGREFFSLPLLTRVFSADDGGGGWFSAPLLSGGSYDQDSALSLLLPLASWYSREGDDSFWAALGGLLGFGGTTDGVSSYNILGILARGRSDATSEEFRILEYLYRHRRENDTESTTVFPFLSWQSAPGKSRFSFMWKFMEFNNVDGKRSGSVFFIPYGGE